MYEDHRENIQGLNNKKKIDINRATTKATEKNAIENSPLNVNCLGCVIAYRATVEPKKRKEKKK